WPNDLVVDGAKLGGILIDHQGEAAGYCRIVVGVGINVTMAPEQAREVDQPWASLAGVLGRSPDRNALAAACLDAVLDALRGYAAGGFTAFRARWQRYDVLQDRPVWLESAAGREAGRAVGIAADGALLVAMRSGVRHCYAGDVSVRDTGP
ncbi:MAG: biotin--[acetyl-CoA-carboxylase] ligase, partial [Salinisphaera sp.]|nr:biotin--[acetyl-CoA-carboxylase] ligase [Salinisphaera sp.]